jgi:hypothetical protein
MRRAWGVFVTKMAEPGPTDNPDPAPSVTYDATVPGNAARTRSWPPGGSHPAGCGWGTRATQGERHADRDAPIFNR